MYLNFVAFSANSTHFHLSTKSDWNCSESKRAAKESSSETPGGELAARIDGDICMLASNIV